MRVVCINDEDQERPDLPTVKKGNIYTVMDSTHSKGGRIGKYTYESGIWYQLLETGPEVYYHSSCFIEINEDQQDETEMVREQTKELFTEAKYN